jgi:ubiquitin-protein ligase
MRRIEKEMQMLATDPGPGISAWKGATDNELEAQIVGPENSPYDGGIFNLSLRIPERPVSHILLIFIIF